MRREWRWGIAAVVALSIGAIGAEPYAKLAAPYYTVAARWIAEGRPWQVAGIDVAPNRSGPGSVLRLTGFVRQRADDAQPAANLISKLQVAAVVESPLIFWTVLFLWPVASCRRRVALLALGVPVFLGLEGATTVCQLINPLAYGSAVLAGGSDPVTPWEHWSRFLEAGGRVALAVGAALLVVAIVGSVIYARSSRRRPMNPSEIANSA
ncbi:MAG TPA: hypothetical protein VGN30_15680 [Steroidobacteraceae bacterium]|jgi:hypothetical protein